ncbi:hypothetical protein AAGC94_17350 [Clostridium sporogenes]|uniref:Uncharacterized protein n=1 Tax=Clostridium liquoris TaxID=1289519 RepID=A0A2T0B5U1_9CLOT|nr:hypothetical protein [Clostridium liquoris]PRR79245.1 hypothetical protein CLLI_09190 [Clostridium liquoris]
MLMLNEKSCIDCDEFEFDKHSEEIEELMEKLIQLEDYDCVVLHKYIDLAHKDREMKVINSSLWDIYELVEYADFKNGVDILIDDEGFLNLSVYGQTYRMDGNDYFINSIFKIIPRDKDWNFLDISDFLLDGMEVKLSEKQLDRKKKSTIELLNEYKGKVDKIYPVNKDKKKRDIGEER